MERAFYCEEIPGKALYWFNQHNSKHGKPVLISLANLYFFKHYPATCLCSPYPKTKRRYAKEDPVAVTGYFYSLLWPFVLSFYWQKENKISQLDHWHFHLKQLRTDLKAQGNYLLKYKQVLIFYDRATPWLFVNSKFEPIT